MAVLALSIDKKIQSQDTEKLQTPVHFTLKMHDIYYLQDHMLSDERSQSNRLTNLLIDQPTKRQKNKPTNRQIDDGYIINL